MIRLGQAETPDPLASRQFRQVASTLCVGAEFEDRQHHERLLDAEDRLEARIDAFNLPSDQSIVT